MTQNQQSPKSSLPNQLQVSDEQNKAIKSVLAWLSEYYKNNSTKQVFTLHGYAGTGKTTLAKIIAQEVKGIVMFAAFSGKAAIMMQTKGCTGASTIHSLIYKPVEDKNGIVTYDLNPESVLNSARLLILDECSMVGTDLASDLLSFGIPILALGDPAQLPPISSEGFFIPDTPDVMLTEIHRQARDNPIIAMSMLIRNEKQIPYGNYGESKVIKHRTITNGEIKQFDQIICGLNKTRILGNQMFREAKGLKTPIPVVGDKVICLKNNRKLGIMNGSLWDVIDITKRYANATKMTVKSIDGFSKANVSVYVHDSYFIGEENLLDWKFAKQYNPFTFGNFISCHKAQGSQWNDVLAFDESDIFRENKWKWLYTCVTRAANKITLVM